MKELLFIQSVSNDTHMLWQTEVQLYNYRKLGYSKNYHVLVFVSPHRPKGESTGDDITAWEELNSRYPEAKFHYYYDNENILQTIIKAINYVPLLRLYCLKEHFKKYPELKEKVIFYHDADIVFTKALPFEKYLEDEVCYLSNTKGYLGLSYLDSKIEHALPEKKETLKSLDPVAKIARCAGITRETLEQNDDGVGGAQYLLKGVDATFWEDCYNSCINMKALFNTFIPFFESPNRSYQGFCSDMWAVLYTLWKYNKKTECPEDFNFTWASDPIEKIEKNYIYHNAGITGRIMKMGEKEEVMFYKGAYANNDKTPFQDKKYLKIVSSRFANRYYADLILEIIKDKDHEQLRKETLQFINNKN